MTKTIEIVAHVYAAKLPHYADALAYSLGSLVLDPPKDCRVIMTVCCDRQDKATRRALGWFTVRRHYSLTGFGLNIIELDPPRLGRRCIGRNIAAKNTQADIVWFADVDQCYRDGILDRLAALEWPEGAAMIYPKVIKIHRDHATGDACLARMGGEPRLLDIDPAEFVDKRYNRAIGGVQIVRGDFARQHGYLDGDPKWQRPTDGRFARCSCDRPYRAFCGRMGGVVGVDLPGMYRLRHSVSGHGRPPSTGGKGFEEGK